MATENAIDRVKHELLRAVDCMRHDLTRVEILAAALNAFSRPIPDYEPAFRHMRKMTTGARELRRQGDGT